ncbi:MAG: aldo/keto reductase [Anaerolineales bacterium]|nr:aldo/keto reductase [Anaerolineales bacterium]
MKYRNLGRTGLKVSELCLGTMQFGWTADEKAGFEVMDAFVEAGGNFLDTADIYSSWAENNPGGVSEEIIGRWMKARGSRRQIIVATKVQGQMWEGPNGRGLSRAHIMLAVEDSLRRLDTDYIDLYQTHWPDTETPIEETLRAMEDLVRQGKVRYIGASNYSAWQLMESLWCADVHGMPRFDALQPHYNLAHRAEFERELKEVCENYEIGVIPYSPLAGGFLTGKYDRDVVLESERAKGVMERYFNERGWRIMDVVWEVANELSTVPAAVSLAWLLAQPGMTAPIIGANSVDQLEDSLAVESVTITEDQIARLDEASEWKEE